MTHNAITDIDRVNSMIANEARVYWDYDDCRWHVETFYDTDYRGSTPRECMDKLVYQDRKAEEDKRQDKVREEERLDAKVLLAQARAKVRNPIAWVW